MVKRTSLEGAACPVARSLDAIGDWWSLLIVRDAFDGLRRFGEFQKNLGMAKNILSDRLRTLVAHGILAVAPASDGSAYQEYVLTEKGEALFPVIVGLRQWGEDHYFGPDEAHSTLIDRQRGQPVQRMEIRAQDGRPLRPGDTVVRTVTQDSR
ncbi:winged helix-turn-helix transcriptional regulator [Achromobacter mucicolens]|uniref:winged helix-turn-helix transcriptional regulator n=1 Tax=Achromobacter mucicolens TaxID=1389922 RepID=UPI001CC0F376|nr:helix-turn-helix domain-containing protein [Achromobacter mucicolens]MDH1523437.1 helix-turn-helix transcriptional regulator [Achromobacter mucicolens]UAN03230.1 helix-turn-helix transcriptional regulator [Achromobacter mucicolens]